MDDLRQSVQSLSPQVNTVVDIHTDIEPSFEPVFGSEEDLVASTAKDKELPLSVVTSDDLMQMQVHDHITDPEEPDLKTEIEQAVQEADNADEDLFILQLQQYRQSLNQGRPITPRRRQKLGLLMKEMASLSTTITEAYFDSPVA